LKIDFQRSRVTSDRGLSLVRDLDERLGLGELIEPPLRDPRHGKNTPFPLADLFPQSVYSRLAAYEDVNGAERLSQGPTFRRIGAEKISRACRGADFAVAVLGDREAGRKGELRRLSADQRGTDRQGRSHRFTRASGAGHGFHRDSCLGGAGEERLQRTFRIHLLSPAAAVPPGDCPPAKLRPGNVHSAEGGEELRLPEIDRQQKQGKQVVFRAGPRGHPAFAKPDTYEALEERGVKYPGTIGRCWRRVS
jgi:hypothetical protein